MTNKLPAESAKNIYQRLHAAMQLVSYVQKGDKKVNGQYSFVSHDAVTAAVRQPLIEQGVIYFPQGTKYVQDGNRTEVTLDIHFVNIDNPDDRIIIPSFGYGIDQGDKGPGKAVSYAVKYGLLKALGLETGDDPDKDPPATHEPAKAPTEAQKPMMDGATYTGLMNGLKAARTQEELSNAAFNVKTTKELLTPTPEQEAALTKAYKQTKDLIEKGDDIAI